MFRISNSQIIIRHIHITPCLIAVIVSIYTQNYTLNLILPYHIRYSFWKFRSYRNKMISFRSSARVASPKHVRDECEFENSETPNNLLNGYGMIFENILVDFRNRKINWYTVNRIHIAAQWSIRTKMKEKNCMK